MDIVSGQYRLTNKNRAINKYMVLLVLTGIQTYRTSLSWLYNADKIDFNEIYREWRHFTASKFNYRIVLLTRTFFMYVADLFESPHND